jgi:hypothetical protein
MKKSGTSTATVKVKSKGLTCVSLGEVESDNEGWCYWKKSYWGLSYSADGVVGSMGSRWQDETEENSWITLQDGSPHTNVCWKKTHCAETELRWDYEQKPDLYVSLPFWYAASGRARVLIYYCTRLSSSLDRIPSVLICEGDRLHENVM